MIEFSRHLPLAPSAASSVHAKSFVLLVLVPNHDRIPESHDTPRQKRLLSCLLTILHANSGTIRVSPLGNLAE